MAALAIAAVAQNAPCFAEERSHGVALYESARFEAAAQYFESVLSSPTATAEELAEAYLYMATLRLTDSDVTEPARLVRAAAAVAPGYAPPAGLPPRVAELHAEALAAQPADGLRLSVEVEPCEEGGDEATLTAEVEGASRDLASTIAAACDGGSEPWSAAEPAEGPVTIAVPVGTAAQGGGGTCTVTARAETGAVLRRHDVEIAPCPLEIAAPPPPVDPAPDAEAPTVEYPVDEAASPSPRTWLWVGVGTGAALVVTAVVLGVVFGTMPDEAQFGPVGLDGF